MEKYLVLATFVGSIIALLFVVITAKKVLRFSEGTPLMQKISQSIRQGANAYLKRQYSVVGVFFACMVVVLCIMAACGLLTWFVPYLRKGLELERWRCFSTGTLLDTARLIRCISQAAGVDRRSVCAFSMGEHGDSSMVPFSAVTVAGVPFETLGLSKEEILTQTRQAGMEIIEGKGSTEFGIGRALAELAGCILRDEKRILPVSVLLDGEYGQTGVHCGVPCRIGKNGIEAIIELDLTQEEQQMLDASCQVIRKHIALAATL